MLKKYNNISLIVGLPGLFLQIYGYATHFLPLQLLGTLLLMIGFGFYAKAKGQHPAWCLTAFLSIIGLIILALLPDKFKQTRQEAERKIKIGYVWAVIYSAFFISVRFYAPEPSTIVQYLWGVLFLALAFGLFKKSRVYAVALIIIYVAYQLRQLNLAKQILDPGRTGIPGVSAMNGIVMLGVIPLCMGLKGSLDWHSLQNQQPIATGSATALTRPQLSRLAAGGFMSSWFFFLPVFGIVFSIAAIMLGLAALIDITSNPTRYRGKVLSIIGIIFGLIGTVIVPFLYTHTNLLKLWQAK